MIPIRNGLKQEDALSPLLLNFYLDFAIKSVQVLQDSLKLNGAHHIWFYANGITILGGSVHTVKKNREALVFVSKETGLEINANKTSTVECRKKCNIRGDNSSFERVENCKYLGTILTKQNSIQEEIKWRLESGNICYHSVHNLLSSNLLSKNINTKIYRTVLWLVVLYGFETWSLTLELFENRMLMKIFEPKRDEVTGEWRKLHSEELTNLYTSPHVMRVVKWRRMRLSDM